MAAVLEIEGLTKDYPVGFWTKRPVRALDQLTLSVDKGEIFGFLGPNGAGKTTTLKLLMRIIYPSAGTARILGHALGDSALYKRIGYLPEQPYFYDYLTAEELLAYLGRLFDIDAAAMRQKSEALLELVGLKEARRTQLRRFSKGMLQRIGIAQAILNEPEIVFLDEPFSGLDPIGRRELREIVHRLNQQGTTVFFSSHILPDVESLCDRFAILHQGHLLDSGKVQEVLDRESRAVEIMATAVSAAAREFLISRSVEVTAVGDRLKLVVGKGEPLAILVEAIEHGGGHITAITPVRPSLEELFFRQIESAEDKTGTAPV